MQATLDRPTVRTATVSESDAQRAAQAYVTRAIDPAFVAVDGARYYSKPLGREIWRFFVRCEQGPLYPIQIDTQTGEVIALTSEEVRKVREKAAIFVARQQGVLPQDAQGYVLAEYARRQADSYLGMQVSLFYSATDGLFVPLARPLWQFTIQVRLPRLGVLGSLGMLDVDAQTGVVIVLTHQQIKRMRERADALVEFRTQTAAA